MQSLQVEMRCRTYFLITAVVSCWSVVQLSGVINTLTDGEDPNFTYHVCCFYNASDPKPWDIRLMLENRTLETEIVDEFTISYTVNLAQLRHTSLTFRCIFPDNSSAKAIITEYTFLRAFNFYCSYTDIKTELECHFRHYQKDAKTTGFIIIMDDKYKVSCTYLDTELTVCNLQYPKSFHGVDRNFTIEMDSLGISQKYVYRLTDIQMRKPYWPTNKPHIEQMGFTVCINFGPNAFNDSKSYEWEVFLRGQNPEIPQGMINADFNETQDVCFETPHFSYQTFVVTLFVRFNHSDAPRITYGSELYFTTAPSAPNEHPKFLSNGFYYDPEKGEIHVFWVPLEEHKFNGPNFTYILSTDTGKKPLLRSNSSAVFHDWNSTQWATVFIWSHNSMGSSLESDHLTVPILTNYTQRQPRNLQYHYHVENSIMTWDPPQDDSMLKGYDILYCAPSTTSKQLCESQEMLSFTFQDKGIDQFQLFYVEGHFTFAISGNYIDESSGGMVWYDDHTHLLEAESNFLPLEIILEITSIIIIALAILIFFFFRIWKRRKVKEIRISLPPIFDPVVMDRLRLRNVDFPSSPDPPVEIMPSIPVPPRIFLDCKETNEVVRSSKAQCSLSLSPPGPVSSPYTTMYEAVLTNYNPPDSVSSPYTVMYTML